MLDEIDHLRDLIRTHKRRLFVLEDKWATQGLHTPPEVVIETQDLREQIAQRERELREKESEQDRKGSRRCAIDFVNRVHELDVLTYSSGPQYWLIDAPCGYGKSLLLRRLKAWYEERGDWICAMIDFRQEPLRRARKGIISRLAAAIPGYQPPGDDAAIVDHIAHFAGAIDALHERKGAVLIFDSVEDLYPDMASWLIHDLVIRTFEYLESAGYSATGRTFRVICAGRYVASNWTRLAHGRLALAHQSLTPFDLDPIMATVRAVARQAQFALTDDLAREISGKIMRLTGGHPGYMAELLTDLCRRHFAGWNAFFEARAQVDTIPFTDEVKHEIPPRLRPALEALSVFRRFTHDTIRFLLERGEIEPPTELAGGDPAWELLQAIRATRLIDRRESFYSDDIVRRLLSIELHQSDPARYCRLCELAEQFYRTALEGPHPRNPHLLCIEIAFQQLQRYRMNRPQIPDGSSAEWQQRVRSTLIEFLDRSENAAERRERIEDIKGALESDWEWQYVADDLLGPNAFAHVVELLEHPVAARPGGAS